MCEVAERLEQRGRAEGRAEGLAEGRAEGLAEGRAEVIERLLKKHMTPEEVSDLLGYSLEEIQKVEESLMATAN